LVRHRRIHEPELLGEFSDDEGRDDTAFRRDQDLDESSEEEEELEEEVRIISTRYCRRST
jgi:hypothetical protein